MTTISREALIERAQTRRSAEREIDGLGTVVVRELSMAEQSELAQAFKIAGDDEGKLAAVACRLIAVGLAEPKLATDDVELLLNANARFITQLGAAVSEFNGLDQSGATEPAVAAAKKNSKTTQ